MKFYGKRLRLIRLYYGWTVEELGNHLGVTKQAISKYESNAMNPSLVILAGMVKLLNVPDDFFSKEMVAIMCKQNRLIVSGLQDYKTAESI